jgi:hypothetical protein
VPDTAVDVLTIDVDDVREPAAARPLAQETAPTRWSLALQQPDAERLILDGVMDGHKIRMQLRLFDRSRLLLVSRGFHWIQETPFNR